MFGSGVLDTVIGVVFVFLLVSLLVTTINEFLAAVIRSRAKWLEFGIARLIGPAWARQLYAHPLVEGSTLSLTPAEAGKLPWWKPERGKLQWLGSGPSYIPSRAFATIVMELLHGENNALRRTEAALHEALDLASAGAATVGDIRGAVDTMAASLPAELPAGIAAAIKTDLLRLSAILGRNDAGRRLDSGYDAIDAADDVRRFIRGIPAGYVRHLIEDLHDEKMGKALLALFDDAGDDIEKFKQNIEVWFNNAMERVAGWYKRRVQWVTGGISLVVVVLMNVDAMLIVSYLDAHPGVRDGLVMQARAYADARAKEPAAPRQGVAAGDTVAGTLKFSFRKPPGKAVEAVFRTDAPGAVFRPEAVLVAKDATSVDYLLDTAISDTPQKATVSAAIPDAEVRPVALDIDASYPEPLKRVQQQLLSLNLPVGWQLNPARGEKDMYLGIPESAKDVGRTLGYHWLGWLITAFAATLGAPFWFDTLNKIMSIRSAGKAPEEMPKSPEAVQAPIGPGQSAAEANRLAAVNRARPG